MNLNHYLDAVFLHYLEAVLLLTMALPKLWLYLPIAPIHCYFYTEVYVAMKKVVSEVSTLIYQIKITKQLGVYAYYSADLID